MEGQVYYCGWSEDLKSFKVWVYTNPKIKAKGETITAAREALWRAIFRAKGDGEPIIEFLPPLPIDLSLDQKDTSDWVALWSPTSVPGYIGDGRKALFTDSFCSHCGLPSGKRSPLPLKIERPPSRVDCFNIYFGNRLPEAMCTGVTRMAFSEEFLGKLSAAERDTAEWRIIESHHRSRKKFYELVSDAAHSFVGKQGEISWTWKCGKCGRKPDLLESPGFKIRPRYIKGSNITLNAGAITVGSSFEPQLCISSHRWKDIAGSAKVKGIATVPLRVLEPQFINLSIPDYDIPTYEKLCIIRDKLWAQYREELLDSEEVQAMKADLKLSEDDIWDYIHARLDDRLALPNLNIDNGTEMGFSGAI